MIAFPAQFRKSANLHIQDGCHGLICILSIDVMLSSRQYLSNVREFFSQHALIDYPGCVRKSYNLHIQDGRRGLICIFKIDVNTPVINIHLIFAIFFLNPLWLIVTAIGSVVDTLVKQVVQNATALISSTMQRQSLLLRYEQDRLEQYSRQESVRVAGIPGDNDETPEQLSQKLSDVLKECEPSVTAEDISVLHRAGPLNLSGGSHNPKRPVLCKFIARSKEEAVMKGKKKLKANEDDRFKHVYVNEDLTVLRAKLFSFARNHPNVKGASTSEGRILCWHKSGSGDNRPTLIESPDDLFKLGLDQVDYKEFGLGDYVFPSTN